MKIILLLWNKVRKLKLQTENIIHLYYKKQRLLFSRKSACASIVIPFQRTKKVIIETIAEGVWCNVKSPCVKSVKTYIQKYYLTLKNKAMRKLAFTNHMRLETLFLEMITFYREKVCQEVIKILPKLKYVNGTFIH